MREGIAQAEAEPPADPALVFEHAYGEPPPSLLAERDDLLGSLGGEGGTGPASTKGARG
jgi:hypothetical protein